MASPKVKKYRAIWDRIKTKDKCVLEVAPGLEPRVRKAVMKEKYKDLEFKVMNEHDKFYLHIEYDAKTMRLTFVLKQRLGLEGKNL